MTEPSRVVSDRPSQDRLPHGRLQWLSVAMLGVMVLAQAWAYSRALPLSLGPRVIMQPWLMNQPGYMIYEQIADQHTPLMPLVISWFVPCGSEGWRLARAFLVALLSLTTVLTWWAGRRSAGWLGGVAAAAFFVCWAGPFEFEKLWHESFLAPLYAALLILFRPAGPARSRVMLVSAGVVCGVALLAKQHAAAVLVAFIAWNLATGWRARRPIGELSAGAGLIALSALVPLGIYCASHYWRAGTLSNLWFWVVEFSAVSRYASLALQPPALPDVWQVGPALILVPAAVLGVVQLLRRAEPEWETGGWGLLLLAAGSLTAYPRFEAFHLQAVLPALAWLSATTVVRMIRGGKTLAGESAVRIRPAAVGIAFGAAVLSSVAFVGAYRLVLRPGQPRAIQEYSNLEPLAADISRVIGVAASVYVFPDDEATANLYYLLRIPPPGFWTFTYPWYMTAPVREQILRTLGSGRPQWIVHPVGRWQIDRHAPDVLAYLAERYRPRARLRWARGEVEVLERRDD